MSPLIDRGWDRGNLEIYVIITTRLSLSKELTLAVVFIIGYGYSILI